MMTHRSSTSSSVTILTEGRALFLVVAVTVLVYANSLGGEFVFDDMKQIVSNPQIRLWSNAFHAFVSDVWDFQRNTHTTDLPPPYYRPLFTIYLTAGYQLFGLWAQGWHIASVLVHTGAAVAVYFLLRRLSRSSITACVGTLIFSIHPSHAESVAWISGIPDPMMAIFYVPAFHWYIRFREKEGARFLIASVIAYAFAVFSKETALSLPLVIGVWELLRVGQSIAQGQEGTAWREALSSFRWVRWAGEMSLLLAPYALVSTGYLAARVAVIGYISWKHPTMLDIPDHLIWMSVPYSVAIYLQHLLAPFYLSIFYGTSSVDGFSDTRFVLPLALLLGLALVLFLVRRRLSAAVWMALALTVMPLLPVLNLKVFHEDYLVQDRYLYLPTIGFGWLVAMAMGWLWQRAPRGAVAATVLLVTIFGGSTIAQNRVWSSSVALWTRAVEYAPGLWSPHYNLGLAHLERRNYEAARTELTRAARIRPMPIILNNLALAQSGLGDRQGATASLQTALRLDPQLVEAHNNLGTILFEQGQYQAARLRFARVLADDPSSIAARFNIARAAAAMNDHAASIQEYEMLLKQNPDDREVRHQLALSYAARDARTAQKQ